MSSEFTRSENGANSLTRGLLTLSEPILVQIMKSMFEQNLPDGSLAIDSLINSGYFVITNAVMRSNNLIFSFMKTNVWLRMILTMGYNLDDGTFTKEKMLPWDDEIIESQRVAIEECKYTSRIHDLLDFYPKKKRSFFKFHRTGDKTSMSRMAELLLQRMHDKETDPYGKKFLSGKVKVVQETNESIRRHIDDSLKAMAYDSDSESMFITILRGEPPKSVDIRYFDVRKVTSMSGLFNGVINGYFPIIDFTYWDTSNVLDMSNMFSNNMNYSAYITGATYWNTCRVKDMSYMFCNFDSIFTSVSNWCTSSVENMSHMFDGYTRFNQPIGKWDTSKVKNMAYMFSEARMFNKPIGRWNTMHVKEMKFMFSNADKFNQDIGEWNIDNVENKIGMFRNATDFEQSLRDHIFVRPMNSQEKIRSEIMSKTGRTDEELREFVQQTVYGDFLDVIFKDWEEIIRLVNMSPTGDSYNSLEAVIWSRYH